MTTTAAQAVLDRVESDDAFAERLKSAGGPDASIALLKSEGFDVTPQELRDALLDRYGDRLTSEQLDSLAAGKVEAGEAIAAFGIGIAAVAIAAVV